MDSITQIVLGAACGEAVLGKKIGNRAMIWGGIGGTLPDLDVLANLFLDPLGALSFHRGPMHSLVFAIFIPLLLGPLVKKLYDGNWYQKTTWKRIGFSIGIIFYLLTSLIIGLIWNLLFEGIPWVLLLLFLIGGFFFFRKRYYQIFKEQVEIPEVSNRQWICLFFISIFTHPLLDSLTTYGTVLFWPFSDMRFSFSTISIVDPIYTIPFAISLLLASLFKRDDVKRKYIHWTGIGLSSCYLIFTIMNKQYVNRTFEQSLAEKNIEYKEYITVPTIFNNLLWYAIAKKDSGYVCGHYSIMDKESRFTQLFHVSGNHQYFEPFQGQRTQQILPWFSDGYYNLFQLDSNVLQYNDLRFGSLSGRMDRKEDFIFKFYLVNKSGILEMDKDRSRPENRKEDIQWFKKRIVGTLRPDESSINSN